jgi:hypothetical protein
MADNTQTTAKTTLGDIRTGGYASLFSESAEPAPKAPPARRGCMFQAFGVLLVDSVRKLLAGPAPAPEPAPVKPPASPQARASSAT